LPAPRVNEGKWSKERDRTKSGRWRKKRSDANQPRKKHSILKYVAAIAVIGVVAVVLIVLYYYFPELLRLP
jgi:uncharacterized membrane protein YukC